MSVPVCEKSNFSISFIFSIITFIFLGATSVFATSLIELSMGELTRSAQWIGRVKIQSARSNNSGSYPSTELRGQILEIYKGQGRTGNTISAIVPGGKRGGKTHAILGFPVFREGGEYLLFLNSNPSVSTNSLSMSANAMSSMTGWTAYRVLNDGEQSMVIRAGEAPMLRKTATGYSLHGISQGAERLSSFVDSIYREMD